VENKPHRLKNRKDFEYLSSSGRTVFGSHWIILKYKKNNQDFNLTGWTIPKYVGKAVLRNKFKRWLRELLEQKRGLDNRLIKDTYNLNFIFRKKNQEFYSNLGFEEFNKIILEVVGKIEKKHSRNIK
jgi:ribonuclease P protein component